MGTSGKSKFHEYRDPNESSPQKKERPPKKEKGPATGGGGSGKGGGGPRKGGNKCEEPITNVALEEVALCAYFIMHNAVPAVGTAVSVRAALVHGRIAVINGADEVVGYLPVEYNYLRRCIEQGFSYTGEVVLSASRPIPTVRITLTAHQ
jgi:hypothetical protein